MDIKKKALVVILLVLLIIDILFIFVYFNKNNASISSLIRYLPTLKKSFAKNQYSPVIPDDIRVLERDSNKLEWTVVMIQGWISEKPFFDKNRSEYVLPVSFNKNNELVVLGGGTTKLLSLLSINGLVSDQQYWELREINSLLKLFNKGDPVILSFNYSNTINPWLKNTSCDSLCKLKLKDINRMNINLERVISLIKNNKKSTESLYLGNLGKIIIYVQN